MKKRGKYYFVLFTCLLISQILQAQVTLMPVPEKKETYYAKPLFIAEPQKSFIPQSEVNDKAVKKAGTPKRLKGNISAVQKGSGSFIKASYQKITVDKVGEILERYGSIPGGITLEGKLQGINFTGASIYSEAQNAFILSDGRKINSLLSSIETRQLVKALLKDNKIGVSLGEKDLVYGALSDSSLPAVFLKMTDHFLGAISFACESWVLKADFPGKYRPKRAVRRKGIHAVYFNFHDFQAKIQGNEIKPQLAEMEAYIIPLTGESDGKGGLIPDIKGIENNNTPPAFENNVSHIVNNIAHYEADSRLKRTFDYGLIASLVRSLIKAGTLKIQREK